jgi:hypothetical protein
MCCNGHLTQHLFSLTSPTKRAYSEIPCVLPVLRRASATIEAGISISGFNRSERLRRLTADCALCFTTSCVTTACWTVSSNALAPRLNSARSAASSCVLAFCHGETGVRRPCSSRKLVGCGSEIASGVTSCRLSPR